MMILRKRYDGGIHSGVTGFFFIELKSLFSIVLLKFSEGSREVFHSHAFHALSIYLPGSECVEETISIKTGKITTRYIKGFTIKWTPRKQFHRVIGYNKSTRCLTFRGRWVQPWYEYDTRNKTIKALYNGRRTKLNDHE